MITSSVPGLPTRIAKSSKIHGMYSTLVATAMASNQSSRGMPPGAAGLDLSERSAMRALPAKTRKIRPSTKAR